MRPYPEQETAGCLCVTTGRRQPPLELDGRHLSYADSGLVITYGRRMLFTGELPPSYTKQRHPAICRDGRIRMYHPWRRGF